MASSFDENADRFHYYFTVVSGSAHITFAKKDDAQVSSR